MGKKKQRRIDPEYLESMRMIRALPVVFSGETVKVTYLDETAAIEWDIMKARLNSKISAGR